MTGNLQAIGFLISWVLLWCLGGVGLDALLVSIGVGEHGGPWSTLGFGLWSAVVALAGWALFNRITGLTQAAPEPEQWQAVPKALLQRLQERPQPRKQSRRLVLVLSQLGDFDSMEYAQAVMKRWNDITAADIEVVAYGIGNEGSAERFCHYTGFPRSQLHLEPEAKLHRELKLYRGAEGFGGAWGNLLAMCAGIGSPGTLLEVLRGYHGGGRYLPFWIASIRLRNMIEVLSHWRTYVPDERWMTQRGATVLLDDANTLLYSWQDRGLLGFTATMADPLRFLELPGHSPA